MDNAVNGVRDIRSEAFLRLKYRVVRLQRLIELGAPDPILTRESLLLAEAAERLAPNMCHEVAANIAVGRPKRLLNLCERDGCVEPVAWIPSAQKPRVPGAFQDTHCLKHVRELEAEVADLDEDAP